MIINCRCFGTVLLLSSFALVQVVEGTRSNSQCDNDTVDMYDDFNLTEASDAFFESFSAHCDAFADRPEAEPSICDFPKGNPTPKTDVFISYAPLSKTQVFKDVANTCKELGNNYKFCTVDTEQQTDNGSINTIGQPLCIPQICDSDNEDDLIDLLDTQGAPFCADDDRCTVKILNVSCASDENETLLEEDKNKQNETASCEREVANMDLLNHLSEFNDFYDALDELYYDVQLSCMNSAVGDDPTSDICSIETEPFSLSMVAEFDRMKSDDSYEAYRSACEEAGGSLCTISSRFDLDFAYEEGISADLIVKLNDLPVCFADSCSSNDWGYDFLEDLVLDAIEDNTDLSRRLSHNRRHRRSLIEQMVETTHGNNNEQERRKVEAEEDSWEDEEFSDGTMVQPWDKVNIGRDPSEEVQQPMNENNTNETGRKSSREEDSSSDEEFLALSDICDALESMDEGPARCNFEFEPPKCDEGGDAQQSQPQQSDATGGSPSSRGGLFVFVIVLLSVGIVVVVGLIVTKRSRRGGDTDGNNEATANGEIV